MTLETRILHAFDDAASTIHHSLLLLILLLMDGACHVIGCHMTQ